ncbi:MAG: hypothetical protein U0176_12710 [Bacteroidia bacterium]
MAFAPGVDAGLGINRLEEVIAQFLCPWAFDPGMELKFGGKVRTNPDPVPAGSNNLMWMWWQGSR